MIKSYMKDGTKLYEVFVKSKDKEGKQIARRKRGIASIRKARDIEFQLKAELQVKMDNSCLWTWKQWLNECILRMKRCGLSLGSIEVYELSLNKWIPKSWNNRKLCSFSKEEIMEDFYEVISNHLAPSTKKHVFSRVKRIFDLAVDEGILKKNPIARVKIKAPKPEKLVLTSNEVRTLLQQAKMENHPYYTIWAFALMTGMRSGEMYALKWTDVDFDSKNISVNKAWTKKEGISHTKNRETRIVPISNDLQLLLKELKLSSGTNEFVLPRIDTWKYGQASGVIKAFCRKIGITEVKFHDLRATFITNLLSQGVPLVTVMSIVGHKQMSTTDVYLRLAGVNVKGATAKLGYGLPTVRTDNIVHLGQRS